MLLPAGFVYGVIGGFMAEHQAVAGGLRLPWGALLASAALVATARALCHGYGTRTAGAVFYAGWLLATVFLALPNPSRDQVFSPGIAGYGYLFAGTVLGAAAAAWPITLPRPAPAEGECDGC